MIRSTLRSETMATAGLAPSSGALRGLIRHGAAEVVGAGPGSAAEMELGNPVYEPRRMRSGLGFAGVSSTRSGVCSVSRRCEALTSTQSRAGGSRSVSYAASQQLGCSLHRHKFRSEIRRASRRQPFRGPLEVRASVEEDVKASESGSSDDTQSPAPASDPQSPESTSPSPPNPFSGGKISSRIAMRKASESQQPPSASSVRKPLPKKSALASNAPVPGQLSANAASQLKVAKSPSVFTAPTKVAGGNAATPLVEKGPSKPVSPVPQPGASKLVSPPNPFRRTPFVPDDWERAGARKPGSGRKVLDAFKEGERDGITPKFGQARAPENIFNEVRRTPEEIAADKFKFEISPGQFVLVVSFLIIIGVMFGTVFLVWKLGGIHYNEY